MPIPRTPLADRFWPKVQKREPYVCWLWTASLQNKGYGQIGTIIGAKPKQLYAHRVAWELTHGPIPKGQCVLHKCDNPPCCNPGHLFLGTKAENTEDMVSKGRQASGERSGPKRHPELLARGKRHGSHTQPWRRAVGARNGSNKLTEEQVLEIRATAGSLSQLAAKFGVNGATIHNIRHRKTWRHLP